LSSLVVPHISVHSRILVPSQKDPRVSIYQTYHVCGELIEIEENFVSNLSDIFQGSPKTGMFEPNFTRIHLLSSCNGRSEVMLVAKLLKEYKSHHVQPVTDLLSSDEISICYSLPASLHQNFIRQSLQNLDCGPISLKHQRNLNQTGAFSTRDYNWLNEPDLICVIGSRIGEHTRQETWEYFSSEPAPVSAKSHFCGSVASKFIFSPCLLLCVFWNFLCSLFLSVCVTAKATSIRLPGYPTWLLRSAEFSVIPVGNPVDMRDFVACLNSYCDCVQRGGK